MSKKPAKPRQPSPSPAPEPPRDSSSVRMIVIVGTVAVLALIGAYQWRQRMASPVVTEGSAASATPASENQTVRPAKGPLQLPAVPPEDAVPASAKFGPHTQESYPPLPESGYPPPRPMDTVAAVYRFAAEHPEVLGYIPCYCGCDRQGHKGNDDCFVAERNAKGDVQAWDSHGMT